MLNPCEVKEPLGKSYMICSQETKGCEVYHYDSDNITADDIAHALVLTQGALAMLSYFSKDEVPFFYNVRNAVEAYNSPGIRAEMVKRIYFHYQDFDFYLMYSRIKNQIKNAKRNLTNPKFSDDIEKLTGKIEALEDVKGFMEKKMLEVKPDYVFDDGPGKEV